MSSRYALRAVYHPLFFAPALCWCTLQQALSMLSMSAFTAKALNMDANTLPLPILLSICLLIPISTNRRQVLPRRTCPKDPEDAIDCITDIIKRTSFATNRQVWIYSVPLFARQVTSPRIGKSFLCMVIPPAIISYIDHIRFIHYSTRPNQQALFTDPT